MLGQIVCFLVLASILWSDSVSRAGNLDAAPHGVDDFLDAVAIRRDNSMTLEIPFDIIVSTLSPDTRYVFEYLLTLSSLFSGKPRATLHVQLQCWDAPANDIHRHHDLVSRYSIE